MKSEKFVFSIYLYTFDNVKQPKFQNNPDKQNQGQK